jgi:hypothetical protein
LAPERASGQPDKELAFADAESLALDGGEHFGDRAWAGFDYFGRIRDSLLPCRIALHIPLRKLLPDIGGFCHTPGLFKRVS